MPTPVTPPEGSYLVTGANGFIGAHLARRLLAAKREVILADLHAPAVLPEGASFTRLDLREPASVAGALRGTRPDWVIHLAAKVGDWGLRADFEAVNVRGARALLDAAVARGARRAIHVSSIAAMGLDAGAHADASVAPRGAGDAYSDTKAAGEREARALIEGGAPITIVRPGDVYGVGCTPWVDRPISLLRKGMMILVEGGAGHFAHVHVDNLIDAMLLALARDEARGETFIVTDDADCTVGEYFTRLADVCALPRPRRVVSREVARAVAASMELAATVTGRPPPFTRAAIAFVLRRGGFDITRTRDRLGYAPRVTLAEGLAEIGRAHRGGARP